MVRFCAFPGCEKKMKNNIPETFHRLPFRCSREIINQWLLVLQLDINTPIETLRKRDHRVCSDHFDQGDFNVPTGHDIPKRVFLRKHAIPKAVTLQVAAERVKQDTLERDRPPGQIGDTVSGVVQPGEDSLFESTYNTPETSTATTEKVPLQHIVDKEAILQLMKNCPMCDRKCRCTKHSRGPYFIVYQSCYFCHYQRKWASQPEALNMNINKAHTGPKKKHQPKEKLCVNAKAKSSKLKKLQKLT
ncbi:uncharacterized protein LOC115586664 isoform X4 [Sparus aurata]|uniref:uncharacterized protein LOC115586664 isoform X4 n=1 Tax=Sparus aurata TaxID=8175 RepID=UPI0011C12103|nr:uncharacterized protein LOC115586664 isoform X4 [Sparus aurata]